MDLQDLGALVEKIGITALLSEINAGAALPADKPAYVRPASEHAPGGALHAVDYGTDGPPDATYGKSPDPEYKRGRKGKVRLVWPERIAASGPVTERTEEREIGQKVHLCPRGRCEHGSHTVAIWE